MDQKEFLKKKKNCKPRQYWIRPGRTNSWWLGFHQNGVAPSEWEENFHMSRESLLVLCTEVNDHSVKRSTGLGKAVSVEKQVILTLYCLSDEGCLGKTATAFGLGKSTDSQNFIQNTAFLNASERLTELTYR